MNKIVVVPFILVAMLLLAACSPSSVVNGNSQPNLENTQQAATATGVIPLTGSTPVPTATEPPTPTPTQIPTQLPTQMPAPTLAPTQVIVPCNLARFVGDVTIPDGSLINPGETFTKIWRLQNIGSCSWTTGYDLVFYSGDLMGGPTVVPLPGTINPGSTVDLAVTLTAPYNSGTYQGNWMLRDPGGNLFGVGSNGSQPFWVTIVVGSSTGFLVTEVDTTVNPSNYVGVCPVTVTFKAKVWTNGAGTVTYYWQRSDGSTSDEGTLTYTGSGRHTVSDTWELGTAGTNYSGWDQLYIDQPNQEAFDAVDFSVTCNSSTATPTITPTPTPTNTPAPTATQPAPTPTNTPAPTATQPAPTPTNTPAPTATQPAPTPTNTPAPTATQPAPTPTNTPAPTPTPTNTPAPTATQPAPTPTNTPAPTPTPTNTPAPTATQPAPTSIPTNTPVPTATQPAPTPTPTPTSTPKPKH